jgi:hypothetical protein
MVSSGPDTAKYNNYFPFKEVFTRYICFMLQVSCESHHFAKCCLSRKHNYSM